MAGLLSVWLRHDTGVETSLPLLASAVRAGHRAAARELSEPRAELPIATRRSTGSALPTRSAPLTGVHPGEPLPI